MEKENKYKIEKRTRWKCPEENDARILGGNNVPRPLHGCLEPDAEVLTKKGWVYIKDIHVGDSILCWNNGEVFFDTVLDTVSNDYHYAYKIGFNKAKSFDMIYSPDHRLPLCYKERYHGRKKQKLDTPKFNFFVRTAEEFCPGGSTYFITSAESSQASFENLTPKEKLAMAIKADGSLKRDNKNDITYKLAFKKQRKIVRLIDILEKGEIQYTARRSKDYTIFHVRTDKVDYKKLYNAFSLDKISYEKARQIIDELSQWDGYNGISRFDTPRKFFVSTDKDNIDFAQAVAVMAGYTTTVHIRKGGEKRKDCWTVWFMDKKLRGCGKIKKELIPHSGKMYCVTVPTSFFVARYHNTVVVTGNCAPRVYMGQAAWDKLRKRTYYLANYKCQICGADCSGPGKCAAHELYTTDYKEGTCVFVKAICICPRCHDFFHSGRLFSLFKEGVPFYNKKYLLSVVEHGFELVDNWNKAHPDKPKLKVYSTFTNYAKRPKLQEDMERLIDEYHMEFWEEDAKKQCKWKEWRLVYGAAEFPTPYENYEEWQKAMQDKRKTDLARQDSPFVGKAYDEILDLLEKDEDSVLS